jgi:toxin ParE1/3/4
VISFKISKEALTDLESLWLYTAENWSVQQADRYYNLILDEIDFIAQNPKAGKEYSHVRKGYYRSKVKSHFIFYRLKEDELQIIRILHQQMDIDARLNE